MLYFKINDYLTLKLEQARTNIYVRGRLFSQCKYLLMDIQTSKIRKYDTIDSIDEAAELLDNSLHGNHRIINYDITPETEFWGHCSNLQAWAENDYDTRLLHRNLAFPLLKALADAGDPKARGVFKDEIALRLASGYPSVVEYLFQQGYLSYLTKEEFQTLSEDSQFLDGILENFANSRYDLFYLIIDKNTNLMVTLFLYAFSLKKYRNLSRQLLTQIKKYHRIHWQDVLYDIFYKLKNEDFNTGLDEAIKVFGKREIIDCLQPCQIEELFLHHPEFRNSLLLYEDYVFYIEDNECLDLAVKNITDLTKLRGLKNFAHITKIILSSNSLTSIKGLEVLHNLEEISLRNNKLESSFGFEQFPHLKKLNLAKNKLADVIGLKDLINLQYLDLSSNNILEIKETHLPPNATIDLTDNLILNIVQDNSPKFQIEFQISHFISVLLDEGDITIRVNNESILYLQDDRVYICENGIYQRQSVIRDGYPGLSEVEYISRKYHALNKPTILINHTYPSELEQVKLKESAGFSRLRNLCSNLKLWIDYEFDFRLLRKDIALPLLNKLGKLKNMKKMSNNSLTNRNKVIKNTRILNSSSKFFFGNKRVKLEDKNVVRVPLERVNGNSEPIRAFKTYKIVKRLDLL